MKPTRLRAAAAAITAVLALGSLAACGSNHEQGPAGQVVAKDKEHDCHWTGSGKRRHQVCDWEYELTTRDKQGDDHEFEVPSAVYDNCRRGSAYPGCTER